MTDLRMWLKFATQNTLRNRRRSLVTVSIAALGTAAILLAGGFALSTYTKHWPRPRRAAPAT